MDGNGNTDLYSGIGGSDGVECDYIESYIKVHAAFTVILPKDSPFIILLKITGHKKVELKVAN